MGWEIVDVAAQTVQGSMRVTVPSPLLATQTASGPTTTAPGSGPTWIGSADRFAA